MFPSTTIINIIRIYATIMMFIESNAVLHDIVVNCCIYGINGNADLCLFSCLCIVSGDIVGLLCHSKGTRRRLYHVRVDEVSWLPATMTYCTSSLCK